MKLFIILLCCSLLAVSVQCKAAYTLKITRLEVLRSSKVFGEGRMWITKPNRYTNAMNGEFYLYNISQDSEVKIKMYEFLSNEYRPFAINLKRSLCSFMVLEYKMMLYPDLLKLRAHMPEPRCPVLPGNYSFANLVADISNYPANVPFHNFMMEIEFWHGTMRMLTMQFYGTLDRDAVIREHYG